MAKRWVLLANSSSAEIFEIIGKEVKRKHRIDFPEGRELDHNLYSDRPGRGFEGRSTGGLGKTRHAYSPHTEPHLHEQQVFASQVACFLDKALSEKSFEKIVVIAPPQFLGELRHAFSDSLKLVVEAEHNKDISSALPEAERIEAICKYLDLERSIARGRISNR